ncbi:hypothetical protein CN151_17905 [Sinorhizobium meliloti]|nr:hypothetical protein C770_GR4pD1412 [Sinorhizobium meliloti GR4]RVH89016.1 hypothetical protein CN204_00940 [Sinorhizobium meliloti]RVL02353.1 hypothetical protein CN151_17905 [Sinorhizobium meliloti]RVM30892.1 hypothetical protein CN132_06375 [Sinorhizobium meliloti]RVM86583.1 hypothetical protein CN119_29675 [Sinorhizobium meliloti]
MTRRGLFDLLIPVLVTGIQPGQVLGLEELFPRHGSGEIAVLRHVPSFHRPPGSGSMRSVG